MVVQLWSRVGKLWISMAYVLMLATVVKIAEVIMILGRSMLDNPLYWRLSVALTFLEMPRASPSRIIFHIMFYDLFHLFFSLLYSQQEPSSVPGTQQAIKFKNSQ